MIKDDKLVLKEKFLEYYSKMPIKKYAAYSVGRDEDTILIWQKDDSDFSDRIKILKADYLLNKANRLPATFIIPLLFRELTPRHELTGKEGESIKFGALTDEQLDKVIESKIRKAGVSILTSGKGETDSTESA